MLSFIGYSQQPSIAVLKIDNSNASLSPDQLASLARVEIIKTGQFEILDPYDIQYLFDTNDFAYENCYGKICLINAGELLEVDKVLSGSVEYFEHYIVITLRQVDVKSKTIEKTTAKEFLKIDNQLGMMMSVAVQEMYGIDINQDVLSKLTKKDDFESTVNVPEADVLNLSGPRMGLTLLTGEAGRIYQLPKNEGGFNALPVMTQFGYQFEAKYLNSGNVQALFEIIPMISGLDQGRFIPNLTVLSGIRSNKNGFEFAFGPNIFVSQIANGYYDSNDEFIVGLNPDGGDVDYVDRLDSRGDYKLGSGFVLAFGKTFRSGKLNIPVNAFYIPAKGSHRFGISFGFNIHKTK
jgi:hypothetical protein